MLNFCSQVIRPSRWIWCTLAAIWVLILAVNICMRDNSEAGITTLPPTRDMSLQYQQQLLDELSAPSESSANESQKTNTPGRPENGF
jgi:hypothetical protein